MSRRPLSPAYSASKFKHPGAFAAMERYTGPFRQTFRAVDPMGRLAFASAPSADIDWKLASTPVEQYERRLTPNRARELITRSLAKGLPITVPNCRERPGAPSWFNAAAAASPVTLQGNSDADVTR